MTQGDAGLESLVRNRIRGLRVAHGWSLEELATRANLSASTLSRIETGRRRLALDQLVALARALDTSVEQLVEAAPDDVVTSPVIDRAHGWLRWPVRADPGLTVVRQRLTEPPPDHPARMHAHPGRESRVAISATAIRMLAHRGSRREDRGARAPDRATAGQPRPNARPPGPGVAVGHLRHRDPHAGAAALPARDHPGRRVPHDAAARPRRRTRSRRDPRHLRPGRAPRSPRPRARLNPRPPVPAARA